MEVLCRVCYEEKTRIDRVRKALKSPQQDRHLTCCRCPPEIDHEVLLQRVSWFAFHCYDKYHDQRQCGKQGIIIVYGLQTIIQATTQGRK